MPDCPDGLSGIFFLINLNINIMAIFQLGAIVTKIKGSIGGTSFKSQRGTNVMFRKSNGYSSAKELTNRALAWSRYIFVRWTYIDPILKEGWSNMAAIILFPDKFGNQIHISGRQLYTKCNIALQRELYYEEISPSFTTSIPFLTLGEAVGNVAAETISLPVTFDGEEAAYIQVSAEVRANPLQSPVFGRRETLLLELVSGATTLELGQTFFAKFPYITSAYNARLYVTPMNIYGIKGSPLTVDVVFEPQGYYFTAPFYRVLPDFMVTIALQTNIPMPAIFRMYYQTSDVSMPAPDFNAATLFLTQGLSNIKSLLDFYWLTLPPANLRYGNFIRLWLEPVIDGVPILPPQSYVWEQQVFPLYEFAPLDAFETAGHIVLAEISTNLPPNALIRVTANSNPDEYPTGPWEPSFIIGNFAIDPAGVIDIGTALMGAPYNIELGWKNRIWLQPYIDNTPVDCPMPLNVSAYNPINRYLPTNAYFISESGDGDLISDSIFNTPTPITPFEDGVSQIQVQFANWLEFSTPPDCSNFTVTVEGFGTILASSAFTQSFWDSGSFIWVFRFLKPAYHGTRSWVMPIQDATP